MAFARPTPRIGDRTSAAARAADPGAWRMPDTLDPLAEVIGARRDIRRFRPDEVPPQVLTEILAAGHRAPSVGHSQPWRFIVVRAAHLRDRAAVMADRARLRQAAAMSEDSARGLLDLRLEGIREAPLGIVVACDRRTPAAGVLGRATFPDTDLWSCACAIQNMWLTARAHGLGLGWVTLFEPAELADLLGLPEGVQTLGWLCLGWPDERPPEPGLERAGWSRRLPLEQVVMQDGWQESPAPANHLAAPDQQAYVAVRDEADQLLTPVGSLGVLDTVLDRVRALPAATPDGLLVVAAADHAVTRHAVSAFESSVTADVWAATCQGHSLGAVAAARAGIGLLPVDAGVGVLRGDLLHTDALTGTELEHALQVGRRIGGRGPAGLVALGEIGIGNTTVAAALTSALLGLPADRVVGRGAGADTAMITRKAEVVAAAVARVGRRDPLGVLAGLGGAEIATLVGVVLGTVARGAAVVLDGLATSVAALVAVRLEPAVAAHLVAGQRSREPGHAAVLTELGLEPLLDLRIRTGEGVGAALACQLVLAAHGLRAETARTVAPDAPQAGGQSSGVAR